MRSQGVRSLVASVSSVLAIGLLVSLGAQTNDRAAVPIAPVVQVPAAFSGSTAAPSIPEVGVDPLGVEVLGDDAPGVTEAQLAQLPGKEALAAETPEEAPGEDTTVLSVPSSVPTVTVAPVTAVAAKAGAGTLLSMPLQGRKTSRFGTRFHPIRHVWKLHSGLDLAAPCGTPVGAAAAGRVVKAGWAGGNGVQVKLDHGTIAGRKVMTTYNHLSALGVQVGEQVAVHQGVGRVGNTGYSTGCHLHFEVIANGQFTDPEPWLNGTSVAVDTSVMNGGLPAAPRPTTAGPLTSAASPSPSTSPTAPTAPSPSAAPPSSPTTTPSPSATLPGSPAASAPASPPTPSTSPAPSPTPSGTAATTTPHACPSVTPGASGTPAPCTSPATSAPSSPVASPVESTSTSATPSAASVAPSVTITPPPAPTTVAPTVTVPPAPTSTVPPTPTSTAPTSTVPTSTAPASTVPTSTAPTTTGGSTTALWTAAQSPSSVATTTDPASAAESTPED